MTSAPLKVNVIRTSADFAELGDEWNKLLEDASAASICLTWEWLNSWWNVYGTSEFELHILKILDGDKLVGIAPFVLQSCCVGQILRFRTLRFLGTGEPDKEGVVSEYLDVIARNGEQASVARAVWTHLRHLASAGAWDQIIFSDILANSLALTKLRPLFTADRTSLQTNLIGIRYWVDLPQNVEEYARSLDPSVAKRIAYKRRKLDRAGLVGFSRVATTHDLGGAFSELIRLHTLRWARDGEKGAFVSGRFKAFHLQLAETLLPHGILNIELLSLNGANIAVLYNFQYRGTVYFYQGGFDIDEAGKYSPGLIAHILAIESAISAGMVRYDFMRGDSVSYKAEFGCGQEEMYNMVIFGDTAKGRVLAAIEYFTCELRKARASIRILSARIFKRDTA